MTVTGFQAGSSFSEIFKGYAGFVEDGVTKGLRIKEYNLGAHSWRDRCVYYDQIMDTHPLAKSLVNSIAGQLTAQGVFVVENDRIHTDPSPMARNAKEEIEQLNDDVGLESVTLYDEVMQLCKHGSVFLEVTRSPRWDMRIIPFQETIEPAAQDAQGNIVKWKQNFEFNETASWMPDTEEDCYIVPIHWGVSSRTWPHGTSLFAGLDSEFQTLKQLKLDIAEYMHNNAFPMEIFAVGDGQYIPQDSDLSTIRSIVKVAQPGQKLVTSYPIDHRVGGTGDRDVKGMDTVLNFVKEELVDGGGVPPISKIWNSTNASATAMLPWTLAIFVQPLQRLIAYAKQEFFYKPYLEELGYSRRLCPRLMFSPPDAHKLEDAQYWSALINAGLPGAYAWQEMGFDVEAIQKFVDEQDKRNAEKLKLQAALNPPMQDKPQTDKPGKGEVTEYVIQRRSKAAQPSC